MVTSQPHFLLFLEAEVIDPNMGRWRFQLESADGEHCLEVSDEEQDMEGESLELLAVVRGLEALDQPSRVTLVTSSRRISLGFRHGLDEWRQNGWRWERDGRWVPIKNGDLWQRVDRALKFHRVMCRSWRFENARPARAVAAPHFPSRVATTEVAASVGPASVGTGTASVAAGPVSRSPVPATRWQSFGRRLATAAQHLLARTTEGVGASHASQLTT